MAPVVAGPVAGPGADVPAPTGAARAGVTVTVRRVTVGPAAVAGPGALVGAAAPVVRAPTAPVVEGTGTDESLVCQLFRQEHR